MMIKWPERFNMKQAVLCLKRFDGIGNQIEGNPQWILEPFFFGAPKEKTLQKVVLEELLESAGRIVGIPKTWELFMVILRKFWGDY